MWIIRSYSILGPFHGIWRNLNSSFASWKWTWNRSIDRKSLSFLYGCACNDIHWIWFLDGVLEIIQLVCCCNKLLHRLVGFGSMRVDRCLLELGMSQIHEINRWQPILSLKDWPRVAYFHGWVRLRCSSDNLWSSFRQMQCVLVMGHCNHWSLFLFIE